MNATVTSRAQVLAVPLLFWLFWEARAWGPQGSVLTRGVVQGGCHGALVASVGVVLKFAQTLDHILIYVRLKEPDFGEPGLLRSQIAVLDGRVLQGTLEGSRRPRLCECCVVKWQMLGCTPSLSGGIKPVFGAPHVGILSWRELHGFPYSVTMKRNDVVLEAIGERRGRRVIETYDLLKDVPYMMMT